MGTTVTAMPVPLTCRCQVPIIYEAIMKKELTQEYVRSILDYDAETGNLIWSRAVRGTAKGSIAGANGGNGYRNIGIDRYSYMLHRIVWLYHNGQIGDMVIDHINGVRDDNRIENLRVATIGQNIRNQKNRGNKWGYKGVGQSQHTGKFYCQIAYKGKRYVETGFDTPKEAHRRYCELADELHGEFANYG